MQNPNTMDTTTENEDRLLPAPRTATYSVHGGWPPSPHDAHSPSPGRRTIASRSSG